MTTIEKKLAIKIKRGRKKETSPSFLFFYFWCIGHSTEAVLWSVVSVVKRGEASPTQCKLGNAPEYRAWTMPIDAEWCSPTISPRPHGDKARHCWRGPVNKSTKKAWWTNVVGKTVVEKCGRKCGGNGDLVVAARFIDVGWKLARSIGLGDLDVLPRFH